jgi:hypothetical protein
VKRVVWARDLYDSISSSNCAEASLLSGIQRTSVSVNLRDDVYGQTAGESDTNVDCGGPFPARLNSL